MSKLSGNLVYTPLNRALLLLLGSFLFFMISLVLWVPLMMDKSGYVSKVTNAEIEIAELKSKISLAKTLKVSSDALKDINNRVGENITQARLISELNKIVSKTGVSLTDQEFKEASKYDGFMVYKQSLGISGKYKNIRYFLSQISTQMPGLNVVSRMVITPGQDGGVVTEIELDTYSAQKV